MTVSATTFNVNGTYNFGVLPDMVTLLGNEFNGVVVKGILDRETAAKFTDITAKFQQLLAYMPDGLSENPNDYQYLRLLMPSGSYEYVCTGWILESSIVETTTGTIVVEIAGTAADQSAIRNLLLANGRTIVSLTIK